MRLTRRAFIGSGAVAAAGGAAVVTAGQRPRGRRWLHSIGLIEGPDLAPPDVPANVRWRSLSSTHVGGDVRWGMFTPDDPQALLLCLHGRGASHRYAFESIGVERFTVAAGLPWAVVAPDGGSSSYWHPRKSGIDPQAMLVEELLPAIEDEIGRRLPTLLLGWSMGGYGALLAATERPDLFSAVVASSPAIWPSFKSSAPGAFDDADDFREHDLTRRLPALAQVPFRIDCGEDDPFAPNLRRFEVRLESDRVHFHEGFHDAPTWRSFIPHQLRFLRAALGVATRRLSGPEPKGQTPART